jgi:hypothetical protein
MLFRWFPRGYPQVYRVNISGVYQLCVRSVRSVRRKAQWLIACWAGHSRMQRRQISEPSCCGTHALRDALPKIPALLSQIFLNVGFGGGFLVEERALMCQMIATARDRRATSRSAYRLELLSADGTSSTTSASRAGVPMHRPWKPLVRRTSATG